MGEAGFVVRVKADDLGKLPSVDADRLRLRGEVARWQGSKVLHRVVIFRNQHIAVVRNNCAIAKITDNDPAVVDAEQLVEVRSTQIVEHKKIGGICNAWQGNDCRRHEQAAGKAG